MANVPGTPIALSWSVPAWYQPRALRAAAPPLLPGLGCADFGRDYGLPPRPSHRWRTTSGAPPTSHRRASPRRHPHRVLASLLWTYIGPTSPTRPNPPGQSHGYATMKASRAINNRWPAFRQARPAIRPARGGERRVQRSRSARSALSCRTRSRSASNSKSCAADWHAAEADAKLPSERTSSCSATIVISSAGNDVNMQDPPDASFGALCPFRTRCCSLARHHMPRTVAKMPGSV